MSAKGRHCLYENEDGCFGKPCPTGAPNNAVKLGMSETTVEVRQSNCPRPEASALRLLSRCFKFLVHYNEAITKETIN